MEFISLTCKNCNASLDVEDGLDTYKCKYCGYKNIMHGQSMAAYKAKLHVKHMEHIERLQDKSDSQERYRIENEGKSNLFIYTVIAGLIIIPLILLSIMSFIDNNENKSREENLQSIIDEILIDIENEDFDAAYVKANTLHWDGSSDDRKDQWDSTRKEIIKRIKEAEKETKKNAKKSSEGDKDWFWEGWFN